MNIIQEIEDRILQSTEEFQEITVLKAEFVENTTESETNICNKSSRFILQYEKNGKNCKKSFSLVTPLWPLMSKVQCCYTIGPYQKELHMYKEVFPLCKLLLPNDLLSTPFYGTYGEEILILENLSDSAGYEMQKRHKQLDFEHCAEALKSLAKFHAFTVKIQESAPRILDPLRESGFLFALSENKTFHEEYSRRFSNVINRANPIFTKEQPQLVTFLQENCLQMMVAETEADLDDFNVLNHGDFRTDNIIFQYDCYGQVTSARCVNFQSSCWASPVMDVLYFAITSMRFQLFQKYFDLFVEIYIGALNAVLKYLKCDRQPLTIENFSNNIKRKSEYLLFVLLAICPAVLGDPDDGLVDSADEKLVKGEYYIEHSKLWISYLIESDALLRYEDLIIAIETFKSQFEAENGAVIIKFCLDHKFKNPGLNLTSGIIRLKFEFQIYEETIPSSVILKVPSLGSKRDLVVNNGELIYDREVFFYTKILPEINQLWNGDRFSPKLHTVTETQVLVMEDLIADGFSWADKMLQLNFEHSLVTLQILGKYHAVSVKYLQKFEDTIPSELLGPLKFSTLEDMFRKTYHNFLLLVESKVSLSMLEKLRKYENRLMEFPFFQKAPDDLALYVLRHGDLWINNMLFKYDNSGRVCQAKFVDWQCIMKGTPVLDLIYFFACCVQFEVYESHYDNLVNIYLCSLNDTLSLLNYDRAYTRAELDKDMERFKHLYLNFLSVILQSAMMGLGEVPENNSQKYSSIVTRWLNHLERNKII